MCQLWKCGKCSAFGNRGRNRGEGFRDDDEVFAGEKPKLSTGVSTAGEKVQNDETERAHRRGFLLKMGKVVSQGSGREPR